jgi:hydroxyacylglutathione hydrolase
MRVLHTKSGYSVCCILSGRSNVFLLSGNGVNILIDTSPASRWIRLKKRLHNLKISKIDFLILTHTHFDHSGNASKIKSEFGAVVIVNKEEADYLKRGENTVPRGTVLITRIIVNTFAASFLVRLNYTPCQPDILTDQRFDLQKYGINAYIIHTPGHSPGSQSIIVDDEIALVGDSMFGIFPRSVFPPYAADTDEMIRSWGKLLETSCTLFLPSHGTAKNRELLQREYLKRSKSRGLR